ncbi:hypothetical protein Ancab_023066 [Ancistrocladus abbreviatus]
MPQDRVESDDFTIRLIEESAPVWHGTLSPISNMESPCLLARSKIKVSSEEGKELASNKGDNDEVLNFGGKVPRFSRSFRWPKVVDMADANASGSAILIGQSHAREVEMSLGNCNGLSDIDRPNPRPPSILPPRRSSEFAVLSAELDDECLLLEYTGMYSREAD